MSNTIKDMEGNVVNIGDILLLATHSTFFKAKFLGITTKAVKISCYREKWTADDPANQNVSNWSRSRYSGKWSPDKNGEIREEKDVSKHNGSKRISFWKGTPSQTDIMLKIG